MATETNIRMVKDWRKEMNVSLNGALNATHEIAGRSLAEACKHAIILMAQSASKMARVAMKKRPVAADIRTHAEFIEIYRQNKPVTRIFKHMFGDPKRGGAGAVLKGTWQQAQIIKNRGLAKRSWMWGLKALNVPQGQGKKPIPGVGWLKKISTPTHGGFILGNNLSYILKVMPAGWQAAIKQLVANKIMKQAQMRLERQWQNEMRRQRRAAGRVAADLGKYFLRAA